MDEMKPVISKPGFPWKWVLLVLFLIVLIAWLWFTPPGFFEKLGAIGYAVCHRIEARSFHVHDQQVPLCARCTGMYLGAVLGLVFQFAQGKKGKYPPLKTIIVMGVFVLIFGIDGGNSYLHFFPNAPSLYEPQNWSRLVTGMGMGLAMETAIVPAFNQTVWKDWEDKSPLQSWKQLGLLFALAALTTLAVLNENIWVLYPAALFSALGVIMLLTMIYTMVVTMITKRENTYSKLKELAFPIIAGLTLAILQIGVFDLARYLWTGTWAGFNL
ncbi:MAG: DUF2085 domain-containing protein [Anaerolineaceae bacterium]|nr:DUF2085 domain-containing protein [Anaerolineaceae bacterium]